MTTDARFRLRPDLIERFTYRLTTSPVGCAFLATADAAGMLPRDIVEPNTALQLLGAAAEQLHPHAQDVLERSIEALSRGPALTRLARQIMQLPEAHQWWAPLDRERQIWTSLSAGQKRFGGGIIFDGRPPDLSAGGYFDFTSTQVADLASLDIAWVWDMAMDQIGGDELIRRERVAVAPTARIYEIREFADWRELVRAYPSTIPDTAANREIRQQNAAYDWAHREVRLDRSAASQDWDGIHLSFGGVLLSTVIVGTIAEGWTWNVPGSEHTHWLNRVVTRGSPLMDLEGLLHRHQIDRQTIPTPIEDAVRAAGG